MTRGEILDKAKEIITKDRNNRYGEPEDNFEYIAKLWEAYLSISLDSADVASMMALLKIARFSTGVQVKDSYIDCIGYIACGAELALCREDENGKNDDPQKEGEEQEYYSVKSGSKRI